MQTERKAEQIIITGNNIDSLKKYPDNFFDSIVTDPPYGLGKEPNVEEMLRAWITEGFMEVKGTGFMGKEWDAFVPQPNFWKEIFRVLKHGGHIVAFFGTRTYDWGCMAIRLAGFEIRDCIQWVYGSGFPKSHNIEKAINKLDGVEFEEKPAEGVGFMKADSEDWNVTKNQLIQKGKSSERAKQWEGWGSALKPANEPIVLARKPLEKGLSIAENVLKWGTGGINIDGCRVTINDKEKYVNNAEGRTKRLKSNNQNVYSGAIVIPKDIKTVEGRFPANIILDEEAGKIMDEQSGILKSGAMDSVTKGGKFNVYGQMSERRVVNPPSEGGASRFFYCAKASKSERNKGLEGFEDKPLAYSNQAKAELKRGNENFDGGDAKGHGNSIRHLKNFHPTVKPVKLMQYLVRMITPPNGTVLDPFAGSGTTGVACKIDGFNFVGLELSDEYSEIARARIEKFVEEREFIDECKIFESKKNKIDTQYSLFD